MYIFLTLVLFLYQTWRRMFEGFKGGPDWISERSLASESLSNWRASVLEEAEIYRNKIDKIQRDYEKRIENFKKNRLISDMFPRNHVAVASSETDPIKGGHKPDNPRYAAASYILHG